MRAGKRLIKRTINAVLGHYGYQFSAISQPAPPDDALFLTLASPSNFSKFTIALVGTARHGLHGNGKWTPHLYFPKFRYALAKRGISLIAYREPADAIRNIAHHNPAAMQFVLIYNEVLQRDQFEDFAKLACHSRFRFYNAASTGEIIGDKLLTNEAFSRAGIAVPPIAGDQATDKVFSNARTGTGAATRVVDAGERLDASRYNTLFINTAHEYRGKLYHVALRALAITGTMICAYVRLRPTGEAEASVHAGDTPLDPALIAYFHETLVERNRTRLTKLCEQIGEVLGPGFYAHDILPSQENGELYVCETGFKFDDQDIRETLWPISSDLPFLTDHFTVGIADLAAEEIARQCLSLPTPP